MPSLVSKLFTRPSTLQVQLAIFGAVVVGGAAWIVYGQGPDCAKVSPRFWLSVREVEWRLREDGFQLRSIAATEDRCYAVVAAKGGVELALLVHPITAKIVQESIRN